jgi:alanine racemase
VGVGYADGYPRHAPNGTPVLIHNQRASLAGRVSMDMITVDVTNIPTVKVGDEVCLWGDGLSVNEVAESAGTIGYELLTKVTSRPKREYILSFRC